MVTESTRRIKVTGALGRPTPPDATANSNPEVSTLNEVKIEVRQVNRKAHPGRSPRLRQGPGSPFV